MEKRTVGLPLNYWKRLEDIEGNISDALFMVLDLGFKTLESEAAMEAVLGDEDEDDAIPQQIPDALTEKIPGVTQVVRVEDEEVEEES